MKHKLAAILITIALVAALVPASLQAAPPLPDYSPVDVGPEVRGWEATADRIAPTSPQDLAAEATAAETAVNASATDCITGSKIFLILNDYLGDDGGVAQLFVNQHPLEIRAGKHVFFNHMLTLNEGENTVLVKAVDREGNEMQLSPVKITKKTFDLPETDSRYTVALLPIKSVAGLRIPTEAIYSLFKGIRRKTKEI